MMKHASIIGRMLIYVFMVVFVEYSKEFHDVGAARLKVYDGTDWLILNCSTLALVFTTLNAFFDKSFAIHMLGGGEGQKSGLTAEDFKALMTEWQAQQPPVKTP